MAFASLPGGGSLQNPAVGPWDGQSPSLSRASRRLPLGRRWEWTSPWGRGGPRLRLSSTASGPDFPWGADSAPLSASSSTLVRTAERSPSRALTRAPTRPSIQEGARGPRLRDHMLRHERSEIKEALSIAVSAQQGLEAPLHLSRRPQPLAPGHCPTCGFRRPLPPSTKPRLNKSYRGGRDIKSRLATSRAGNRGGLRPPRPLPPE